MDELGGCLFDLVMKTVTTKIGCIILIVVAIVGGYLLVRELRATKVDEPEGPRATVSQAPPRTGMSHGQLPTL